MKNKQATQKKEACARRYSYLNKNAQVWTLDYIIGLLMFISTIIIAFVLINSIKVDKNGFEDALRDSNHISMTLISQGTPTDWNTSNVITIGVCDINNRINLTKIEEFDKLTYEKTKTFFHISGEYVYYFENKTDILKQTKCFRGYDLGDTCVFDISSEEYKNIARTERLVILNSTIVKMVVLVWNNQ